MRKFQRAICALMIVCLMLCMGNFAAIADTSFTNSSKYLNVRSYGAKGDGTTDDTAAIQKAVNAAKNGQKTVFFPAGFYNVKGSVTVPVGVDIEGITTATCGAVQNIYDASDKKLAAGYTSDLFNKDTYYGTWFFVTKTSGKVDEGATFQLLGDNTVKRVGVVNLMQPPLNSNMLPTAPFIGADINKLQSTKGIVIEDISLHNPYYGIAIYQDSLYHESLATATASKKLSGKNSGPITIRNIMGCSMYRSIFVCGANGKVTIENFQSNFSCYGGFANTRANNEVNVELAACTNVVMSNALLFAPWVGVKTTNAYSGSPVNLDATSLNIECERGAILEACGTQTLRNCYYLLATGYSTREQYTCVTINQPKNGTAKSVYNLENTFFQNAAAGQYFNITLQGGAEVNINNSSHWLIGKPMIDYKHESGATSTVTVRNMVLLGGSGQVASTGGAAYKNGELKFEYCRFSGASVSNVASTAKFVDCITGTGTSAKKLSN